jgi:hypothetical protein
MKETSVVVPEEIPAIGISYTAELPGKKNLVFQTHIAQTTDAASFNAVLDKLKAAAERQFAFGMLEHLKLQLEQEEKLAFDHSQRMAQVDANVQKEWERSNKKGDPRLSARQEQEQRQAYAHAEESKRRIAKVKADIHQQEQIIGS